jgi:energy-coupling factor transporter ATP-binding protein EcfA2
MVLKQSFGSCESPGDEIQPMELLRADRVGGSGTSQPAARHQDVSLFHSQRAAVARLQYAVAQEASLVILCGPGGSGVSTVLSTLSTNLHQVTHVVRLDLSTLTTFPQSASHTKSRAIVFIIDNCHLASDGTVGHVTKAIWQQSPSAAVVLGGRGRLLTLLARDRGLLDKVLLRSVLHPFSFPETLAVVQSELKSSGLIYSGRVPEVIHEVTAGIAKDIFHLIGIVRLVGGGHGDRPVEVADIEQIHERLHAAAA